MRNFWALIVISVLSSCQPQESRYDPNNRLDPKEKQAIITTLVRYAVGKPKNVTDEQKFNVMYDSFYLAQARKIKLEHYYPKGEDFYFLISKPAPSLVEKRNATGGRFRLDDRSELIEYEEIFRTWKMVPDTLRRRSYFLFNKMVEGESLDPWYTKNSGGVEYIEFPDDVNSFDVQSRKWIQKVTRY